MVWLSPHMRLRGILTARASMNGIVHARKSVYRESTICAVCVEMHGRGGLTGLSRTDVDDVRKCLFVEANVSVFVHCRELWLTPEVAVSVRNDAGKRLSFLAGLILSLGHRSGRSGVMRIIAFHLHVGIDFVSEMYRIAPVQCGAERVS